MYRSTIKIGFKSEILETEFYNLDSSTNFGKRQSKAMRQNVLSTIVQANPVYDWDCIENSLVCWATEKVCKLFKNFRINGLPRTLFGKNRYDGQVKKFPKGDEEINWM